MNRTRLITIISLATVLLVGCSGNPGDSRNANVPSAPVVVVGDLKAYPGIEWETLEGTLVPGASGAMGKYATTWGRNCWFGMIVPEGAIDPLGPPVNFVMRWPTKASYLADSTLQGKLIVSFEPDGYLFLTPLTIFTTWMPWEGPPPACLAACPDYGECDDEPTVTELPSIKRYRVTFDATHFSDWRVGPRPPKG